VSFISKLTKLVYDFLDVGKSPHPADCIFVLSGKSGRKDHGIKLWRVGYSPQLIMSIGRQEWSEFDRLKSELGDRLDTTKFQIPNQHQLIRIDQQEVFCHPVSLGRFQTRSEARILMDYVKDLSVRSIMVVSAPAHTRRAALTLRRIFRKSGVQIIFVAAPEKISFDMPSIRHETWTEFGKYILSLF
jgi:hypothetical protein